MANVLKLDEMSIEEKLLTMESLWNDLLSNAATIPSPDWHKNVLADREEGVSNGSEQAVDWATAKNILAKDAK